MILVDIQCFMCKDIQNNHIYIITFFLLLLGFITIPTFASGVFTGGYIIKKFKFTLVGIAKFSFCSHVLSFLFHLLNFALICENKSVAGLTLTYDGFVYIYQYTNSTIYKPSNVKESKANKADGNFTKLLTQRNFNLQILKTFIS